MVPNAGHDDATYKLFIDFAGRFGLPYALIDEGCGAVENVRRIVAEAEREGKLDDED